VALTIRLTRVSPTHHRFEYLRADGTGEALELVTREFLTHDLVHFAVESEAGLRGSFYGLLDRIGGYAELSLAGAALGGEAQLTEMVVGPLQNAVGPELDAADVAERITDFMRDMDLIPPRWLTAEFIDAVRERMRRLQGQWNATPFGGTMELVFEPGG
jgi:hypothetical protein